MSINHMKKLDLLIFCDSPNQAEKLASTVRALGFAITHKFVDSESDFVHELNCGRYTLCFVSITSKRPGLPELYTSSDTVRPDIVALIDDTCTTSHGELIEQGAADVANLNDTRYFKHTVSQIINRLILQTTLQASSQKLSETRQQLMVLLQNSTQAITYIHEGFHVFANPAYLELLGFTSLESVQTVPLLDIIKGSEDQGEFSAAMRDLHSGNKTRCELTTTFISNDEDELGYYVLLCASCFEGEQAIQVILDTPVGKNTIAHPAPSRPESYTPEDNDEISNIYSRHHMLKLLADTVNHARESSEEYMLYLVHLETGPDDENYTNACMQTAANRLLDVIHEKDVLGRYSGNSFLLLSTRNENIQPNTYAQQLRSSIGDLSGLLLGLTHSRVAGVIVDQYCKNAEDAIARLKYTFIQAQEYHDKIKIDTSQFIHAPGSQVMDQVWARRVSTILKNNRLTLTSHPIISLKHDEYERFTLQLQLSDEAGNRIPIDSFRDTVMQTGLAGSVDRWIIFNSARQLVDKLRHSPTTQFFIPLIGDVMLEDELFPWIEKIIKQFNLPSGSISLKTTIDSALEYPQAFSDYCHKLSAINCDVYLTGLDDPTVTHELYNDGKNKIKYLALDSKLLNSIASDPDKCESVEVLVEQCHQHNTLTVVPDVVDPELLSEMWRLGIDMVISTNLIEEPNDFMELDLTATLIA